MDRKKVKALVRFFMSANAHEYHRVFNCDSGLQFTGITGSLNVYKLNKWLKGYAKAELVSNTVSVTGE